MDVRKFLLGATAAAGLLAASAVSASAAIVCAGPVCWHTHEAYDYPPDARVVVHPDEWRWGREEHYTWREQKAVAIGAATAGWSGRLNRQGAA